MVNEKTKRIHDLINKFSKNVNIKSDSNTGNKKYILKDEIKKENLFVSVYLFSFDHTSLASLNEEYEAVPLTTDKLYEYGSIVTFPIKTGNYDIIGLFGGVEKEYDKAINKFNEVKNKIMNLNENEILDLLEKN